MTSHPPFPAWLHEKALQATICLEGSNSSRGRTRTYDPTVNSRLLYRLSYAGMVSVPHNLVHRVRFVNRL